MDTVRCTSCFKADKSQIDLHNKIRCTLVFPGHEKGEPRPCCQIQIIPLCFYISWLWRLNDDYQCWEMVSNNCFNGFIFPDSGDWTQNDYQCWEMVICNWVIGHWFYMVWPSCNLLAQLAIGELQSEKWWFAIGWRIVMQLGHTIVNSIGPSLPHIVRIFNLSDDFDDRVIKSYCLRNETFLAKQSEKEAISISKYQ